MPTSHFYFKTKLFHDTFPYHSAVALIPYRFHSDNHSALQGVSVLMAKIIHGGGLRLSECTRLRIKDLDFERGAVTVRGGKADKDRRTLLPDIAVKELESHL